MSATRYLASLPAGKPAAPAMLVVERVALGATEHRGSAFEAGFNGWHVLAIGQAIFQYRKQQGIDGALFPGIDTHRQRRLHATGDIMKAIRPSHDLGQSL